MYPTRCPQAVFRTPRWANFAQGPDTIINALRFQSSLVFSLLCAAALINALAASANAVPLGYSAQTVMFAENGNLQNPDVNAFNNGADYTLKFFVPHPGNPSLRQTSLVIDEPDAAVQIPLGTLPSDLMSVASDVNDARAVVGTSFDENEQPNFGVRDAFVFPFGGAITMLPRVDHGGEAHAINSQNVVVGHSFSDSAGNHVVATRWTFDGALWNVENLGNFGEASAKAIDINDQGQMLVLADSRSLVVDGENVTELPAALSPFALNNLGQVLGFNGLLFDPSAPGDGLIDTGLAFSRDFNNSGQIVGSIAGEGYLWENGILTRLDDLVIQPSVDVTDPHWINDNGQILTRTASGFSNPAVLLTPVPEPSTITMLLVGGLIAACVVVRRIRSPAREYRFPDCRRRPSRPLIQPKCRLPTRGCTVQACRLQNCSRDSDANGP